MLILLMVMMMMMMMMMMMIRFVSLFNSSYWLLEVMNVLTTLFSRILRNMVQKTPIFTCLQYCTTSFCIQKFGGFWLKDLKVWSTLNFFYLPLSVKIFTFSIYTASWGKMLSVAADVTAFRTWSGNLLRTFRGWISLCGEFTETNCRWS